MSPEENNTSTPTGKENEKTISVLTQAYIGLVVLAGCVAVTHAAVNGASTGVTSGWKFGLTLVAGLAAALLKVRLPGISGTMSVSFLFVLLAIAELNPGEAVAVACAGVLGQYLWQTKVRPRAIQVAFNVSVLAVATSVSAMLFHWELARRLIHEDALLLGLVTGIYFFTNTFPVAVVISLTEKKPMIALWRECYFWTFPYYLIGSAIVAGLHLAVGTAGWQVALIALPFGYVVYRSYGLYLGRLEVEKQHAQQMASLHLRTIEALALAIEAKDHTTNEHLQRVSIYAEAIGLEMGLSESDRNALRAAALLHDIGKLAVPEHIISKPGRLTPEEFEKMKIHPLVGAEILERVQFPYPVVPIVAAHHEKWDGTGYPYGLRGEDIPIGARILSAVDCLDALSSDRQYRKAFSLETSMRMVREQSGISYDPRVVEILERRHLELEKVARSAPIEELKLHQKDARIDRGDQPGAGLAKHQARTATVSGPGETAHPDFLTSIAAARNEAQSLFELSQALGSSLSLGDTFTMLGQRLHSLVPHDGMAVYLISDDGLRAAHASGVDAALFERLAIPHGEGLSGWVASNGRPILNGNPSVEPGYLDDVDSFSTLRSALAVPLDGLKGRVGVLALYARGKDAFTQDHLRILLAVSSKLSLVVENGLRFQAAEDQSAIDHLTGLPNGRTLFVQLEREVSSCQHSAEPLSVLLCDLDGFKRVNDVYGHLEGNRVLREVAVLIRGTCRNQDTVARMGGDEFVVVMPGADVVAAARLRQRIQSAVDDLSHTLFGSEAFGISIGISDLNAGTQAEDLLALADRLMYSNKAERKQSKPGPQHRQQAPGVLTPTDELHNLHVGTSVH
ncbi:MAG: diguanylate cyclase [Bryobacteraceae bacterium]|nr:diguanylate cyclase [Bryobacteraceae bacterium]